MNNMQWCIRDSNGDYANDTNAPDGVHDVEQSYYNKEGQHVTRSINGVIVKDGKIDIVSAMNTLHDFTFDENIVHRFVERMDWDGEKFIVFCGS